MTAMSKPYELVVYGATGYTGRFAVQQLAASYPQLSYAIAGRNLHKLEALKRNLYLPHKVNIEVADATDHAALRSLISKTRTFANLAGPYRDNNGSSIYKICAEEGVNYVDLDGDLPWSMAMMQRHNETAKRTGALMISSTGLDSLPSDLVAMLAVRELKRKSPQCQPGKVVAAYEIKGTGGISGGSLNTIMSNLDNPQPTTDYVKEPQRGQVKLLTTLPDGSYGSFWPFGTNNATYVHRTSNLLADVNPSESYGSDFTYEEHWKHPTIWSAFRKTASLILRGLLFALPFTRPWVRRFGPKSGEGPDPEQNLRATFILTAWASSSDEKTKSKVMMFGKGHPGYWASAKMMTETAVAMTQNRMAFPEAGQQGGVLTPVVGMGQALVDRLETCGDFRFIVE